MPKSRLVPIALTIAGSDSGGGAGIQADLKTFAALGAHGVCAITCVTAQNPKSVSALQACRPEMVRQQIQAVFAELPPAAIKTGMLYSADIIRVVVEILKKKSIPVIVDPVMISTSGRELLKPAALKILTTQLLPLATLATPNADEAARLSGHAAHSVEDLRECAQIIQKRFGCAALVKGGHLKNMKSAVDIFYDGKNELLLSAPFIPGVRTHGTGCTYSAAIAACLARGLDLPSGVIQAKKHVTESIRQFQLAMAHPVLNNFWQFRRKP